MKRLSRDPLKFDVISLFEAVARDRGLGLGDKDTDKDFLREVAAAYKANRDNPILIYGKRAESMFGYVAAALGHCTVIKAEDAGAIISAEANIQPPDYRLVLEGGNQMLIEVKNCYIQSLDKPLKLKSDYVDALEKYGAVFGLDVHLAIYWAKLRQWTLVSTQRLKREGNWRTVNLGDAAKMCNMAALGDVMVGVRPPLVMRLVANLSEPRSVDDNGHASFRVGKVEFYNGNTLVTGEIETGLVYQFMMYGDWPLDGPRAIFDANELTAVEFAAVPEAWEERQGFAFVGRLSQLISSHFAQLTASESGVHSLSPASEPGTLRVGLPKNYVSETLPLWRFVLQPNYDLS